MAGLPEERRRSHARYVVPAAQLAGVAANLGAKAMPILFEGSRKKAAGLANVELLPPE